jgi:hypothetical protein
MIFLCDVFNLFPCFLYSLQTGNWIWALSWSRFECFFRSYFLCCDFLWIYTMSAWCLFAPLLVKLIHQVRSEHSTPYKDPRSILPMALHIRTTIASIQCFIRDWMAIFLFCPPALLSHNYSTKKILSSCVTWLLWNIFVFERQNKFLILWFYQFSE